MSLLGFRKIGTDQWEFANEDFLRGKKSLLKNINRRRSSQVQQVGTQMGSSVEMEKSGKDAEVQKLRRENDLLMQEVVQLNQEHLMTVQQMDALNQRMQSAELTQKQMVSFLARLLQNPVFLSHLKQLKERKEIASPRVRRKFLKHQLPLNLSNTDKSMEQQIVKYRLGFSDVTSPSEMEGTESSESKQFPDYLLQAMVDKLGLDPSRQDFLGDSVPLLEPTSSNLKEKNLLTSQADVSFSGADYFVSLPEDVTSEEKFSNTIFPTDESVSRPDIKTATLKGKNVVDFETDATPCGTEYLTALPDDISQERLFPDAIAPASASACISEEEIWNEGFETGGSSFPSGHDDWDNLVRYDAQEMELAAGPCALWELGLHTLEEDLEIDKYVGGESSSQEHKDIAGLLNLDSPKNLDP